MPYNLSDRDIERIVDTVLAEGGGGNLRDYAAIASVIANRAEVYGVSPVAVVGPQAEFNGTKPAPGSSKYRDTVREIVKDTLAGNRTTTATWYGMPGSKPSTNIELSEVSVPGATHKFYEPVEPLKPEDTMRAVVNGQTAWVSPVMQPSELQAVSFENLSSVEDRVGAALGPTMTTLQNVQPVNTVSGMNLHPELMDQSRGFVPTTDETLNQMAVSSRAPGSLSPRQTLSPNINMEIGKGTIRDQPIQQEVMSRVEQIASALSSQRGSTVTANITSGGQPAEGTKGVDRTGSHRHDNGWSTDFTLSENGVEYVPDQNPGLYADFAGLAAQSGFQGIGVYNHSMHVGTPVEQTEHPGVANPQATWNGIKDKYGNPIQQAKPETAKAVFDAVNEGRRQFAAGNVFGTPASMETAVSTQDPFGTANIPVPTQSPRSLDQKVEEALGVRNSAFNPTDNMATDLMFGAPMPSVPQPSQTHPTGSPLAAPPTSQVAQIDPGRFADTRDGIGVPGVVPGFPEPSVLPDNIPTPTRDPRTNVPVPERSPIGAGLSQTHPTGSPSAAPAGLAGALSGAFNPVDNMATDLMFSDQTQAAPDFDPSRLATEADQWSAGRASLPSAPVGGLTTWAGPGSGTTEVGQIPDPAQISSIPGVPAAGPAMGNVPIPQPAPSRPVQNVPVPSPAPRQAAAPGTPAAVANASASWPDAGSVRDMTGAEFDKLFDSGYFGMANGQKFTPEQMAPKGDLPDGRGGFSPGRAIGGVIGAILGGALAGPAGSAIGNFLGAKLAGSITAQPTAAPAAAAPRGLAAAVAAGGVGARSGDPYSGRTPGDRAISPAFQAGGAFGATTEAAANGGRLGGMSYL